MQLKTTPAFTQAYNQLNPQQKKAVDTLEFPTMVLAGPGSGKTQVLTTRIANLLLKTDANPSNILALTFTESAAKNMRERLVKLIGKTGYYVNISTFHAFCGDVIRQNSEYFPQAADGSPLSDLERYDLFQDLITNNELQHIKPLNVPFHYLKAVISQISNLKREGISAADFAKMMQEQRIIVDEQLADEKTTKAQAEKLEKNYNKQLELLKLYQQYQEELKERQRYDFDDMIMLVIEAFQEHELLLREYQEQLQYFLVDEYQDTNEAQNQVVNLLASYWGDKANIFVVGDPHQAIYRFQGASLENMMDFVEVYPSCEIINLDIGYRCPQEIYDAAHKVIKNNSLTSQTDIKDLSPAKQRLLKGLSQKIKAPTSSLQKNNSAINLYSAPVQTLESVMVAKKIKNLIEVGTNPSEIAVLYRYNADAQDLITALNKWGIRYEVDGGDDILQSEFIQQLLAFFQVLLDLRTTQEDELVYQIMHYPWFGLDELAIMKLGRIAGKLKLSLLEVVDRGYQVVKKAELDPVLAETEFKPIQEFVEKLYHFSSLDHQVVFTAWVEQVLQDFNIFDWIRANDQQVQLLNELNSLYGQIKSMVASENSFKLADFLQAIEVMQEHNLKITAEDLNITQNAIKLATVHKAKGQEWEHVFILQCVDKKWGNHRSINLIPLPEEILSNTDLSKKEANEDDRRVFYVALTRASKSVTISYPETIVEDSQTSEKLPSLFLDELGKIKIKQDEELLKNPDKYLQQLLEPASQKQVSNQEEEFFRKIIKNFKLSVTALNTYLKDPQEFIENNLLRVPRAKQPFMAFGTAVHTALENFYQYYLQHNTNPDEKFLLTAFKKALKKEVLTEQDFKARLKHGQEVLKNYYQQVLVNKVEVIQTERDFNRGWSRAILDQNIHLTGKIDRIDWVDKNKKLVRVVDYKTGRSRSKNNIEGLTKSSNLSEREQALPETIKGPYKRQLVFYQLLLQLDQSFNFEPVESVFEFIEPDSSGKLRPRKFKITQQEVDDLKELIRQVMKEIRSLEFLKNG